jgi:hypothetical protein
MILALLSDRNPPTFDDECDPRDRWIGEADKLKRMLPTVWFEEDVDDDDAEPRDGDGDAAERSEELVHRVKSKKGAGSLS